MKEQEIDCAAFWRTAGEEKTLCRTRIGEVLSQHFLCLRTGVESEFVSFRFPDWVIVLAETKEENLVMVRQFRHGARKVYWEIPGGCIDPSDPDPVSAGLRELREETGFTGKNPRLLGSVCPNPALQSNLCHVVYLTDAEKTCPPAPEATEALDVRLVPCRDVVSMLRTRTIDHGVMMDAMMFYFLEKNWIREPEK